MKAFVITSERKLKKELWVKKISVLVFLAVIGCQKANDEFEKVEPTAEQISDYRATSDRLVSGYVHGGFGVVSRKPDGSGEHFGEALIWGGTALWALPCAAGDGISAAMRDMIERHDGAIVRVEPLGEYVGGREVTLDGAIGLMLGVSRRVMDCGESSSWESPISKMVDFQNRNRGRLHPLVEARMVGEFAYVRDLIAHRIGLRDEPDSDRLRELEQTVGGWAGIVQAAHATGLGRDACFPVNLGLSALLTVDTLGKSIGDSGRNQMCQNTKGMDIPTVDHWCGRAQISGYLQSYQADVWEYRHQRCGSWESPDGKSNSSPQLDKLVAYVFAHGWHLLQN